MDHPIHFDVIVIGAGPAGLSIASELSKHLKVAVVDRKGHASHCTKSWFVPGIAVHDNKDIQPFLTPGVKRFITNTFAGPEMAWNAKLKYGYWFVKEHELLDHWASIIESSGRSKGNGNGSRLFLGHNFQSHSVNSGGVHVRLLKVSTDVEVHLQARLLIDASGSDSQLLKEYQLDAHPYWWSVYGWINRHKSLPRDMKVGDYLLWGTFGDSNPNLQATLAQGRPVMEYEILDDHHSFPMVLYLRKTRVDLETMKNEFEHIIKHEELGKPFRGEKIEERKWGWYPSGGLIQSFARDRVAFVGDAGGWATPCGWGMGFILTNYKKYAANIVTAVRADTLDEHMLASFSHMALHERNEVLVDQVAAHFLSQATPQQIDRFIDFWNVEGMKFLYCEKLFTLTITEREVEYVVGTLMKHFDIRELASVFPREDYPLLVRMLLVFAEAAAWHKISWLSKDLAYHVAKLLGRKVHKHPPEADVFENGFDFMDYKKVLAKGRRTRFLSRLSKRGRRG